MLEVYTCVKINNASFTKTLHTRLLKHDRKDVFNKKCYCVFNDVTIKKTLTTQTVPVMIHK